MIKYLEQVGFPPLDDTMRQGLHYHADGNDLVMLDFPRLASEWFIVVIGHWLTTLKWNGVARGQVDKQLEKALPEQTTEKSLAVLKLKLRVF